jgi:hypothetical protein
VQIACPQVQSMSGIFSMASHWALQYLPEVVTHEQMGCAHFLAVSFVILDLLFQVGTELSKTVSYTEVGGVSVRKRTHFRYSHNVNGRSRPLETIPAIVGKHPRLPLIESNPGSLTSVTNGVVRERTADDHTV